MADWDDVLGDLDRPRPLGPELRARLEEQLTSDGLPLLLASADEPRPLPAELRARLLAELAPARAVPAWRRPGAAAAAAAVVVAVAGATLLQPDDAPRTQVTAQPTAAVPTGPPTSFDTPAGGVLGSRAQEPGSGSIPRRAAKPTPTSSVAFQRMAGDGAASAPQPAAAPAAAADRATPSVTALDPASGPFSGGTVVTITGSGFTADAVVLFGGTQAVAVELVSATTLRATTPAHLPGEVDVTVTTSSGRSATGPSSRFRFDA